MQSLVKESVHPPAKNNLLHYWHKGVYILEIKRYRDEDAQKLADHINGSDKAWPGSGFTHGVPFTADLIREWMEEDDWEVYLAWEKDEIAGYSSLTCIDGKKKTAYVPLLNVHPDFHGGGYGRRLLFKCVQRAIEGKYHRLDLHTWPSNRKAIPLYKKMGFFWNPETSVHMVNYLPLILQNPLIREIIDSREWYGFLQRSFDLCEDVETWEGVEVFNYRWTWDKEYLLVRIDRKAEKIVNIETPSFSIGLSLRRQKNPLNIENSLYWRVSKDREETPVFISYSGDDPFWPSGKVPVRAREWEDEEEFRPAPDLEIPGGTKTSVLNANVFWHNHLLEMGIGLELNQVLKVSSPEELIEVKPGERREIWFNLENMLDRELVGDLKILGSSQLEVILPESDIEIEPRGKGGIRAFLLGKEKGLARLDMVLTYRQGEEYFQTIPWKGEALVREGGELFTGEVNNSTWMVNDSLALKIEGGRTRVLDKTRNVSLLNMEIMEWGLPFNPELFHQKDFQHRVEGDRVLVSVERSEPYRMRLTKKISLAGAEIFTDYELENLSDSREKVTLLPRNSISGESIQKVVLPLREGLLHEDYDPQVFPGYFDLSGPADSFAGLWQAFEGEDKVIGMVMPTGQGTVEVLGNNLLRQKQVHEIDGFSQKTFPGPSFYVGEGDWKKVARLAEKLEWPRVQGPLKKMGEPGWDGNIPLIKDGKGSAVIHNSYPGMRKALLHMEFEAPEGLEPDQDSARVFLEERRGYRLKLDWKEVKTSPGIYGLKTFYRLRGWQKEKFLPLVVTSSRDSLVSEKKGSCWKIENGDLSFSVDPNFAGTLYSLKFKGEEVLASPHPEPGTMEWMYPWFGGVGPTLALKQRSSYPGYLSKEKFTDRWVEIKTPSGLNWQGVAMDIDPEREEFRGLKITISYLTLPQIPVLAVKFQIQNETRYSFPINPRLILFPNSDYLPEGSELEAAKGDRIRRRVLRELEGAADRLDWCSLQGKEKMILAAGPETGIDFREIPDPYQYILSFSYPGLKILGPREELSLKLLGFWGEKQEPGYFFHSLADEFNILEDN